MKINTKTILIVGAVAVGGYLYLANKKKKSAIAQGAILSESPKSLGGGGGGGGGFGLGSSPTTTTTPVVVVPTTTNVSSDTISRPLAAEAPIQQVATTPSIASPQSTVTQSTIRPQSSTISVKPIDNTTRSFVDFDGEEGDTSFLDFDGEF